MNHDPVMDDWKKLEWVDKGIKHDSGKDRWDLLPMGPIIQIVKILTFGAKKYTDNNWKLLENPKPRYYAACLRHLVSWWGGELTDQETGISHLAHAATNLIFLLTLEQEGKL